MKVRIFYFSGTGNTKYVADELNLVLNDKGIASEIFSIEKVNHKEANTLINKSDVVFLAYPIYGSDLPEIMHEFIDKIQLSRNIKLGVICTQLLFSGDGSSVEKKN